MMKHCVKTVSILSAAAILSSLCGMLPASAANAAPKRIGDFNADNRVNEIDATDVLKLYAESIIQLNDNTTSAENAQADINGNGQIDCDDAVSILSYYAQTLNDEVPFWINERTSSKVNCSVHEIFEALTDEEGNPLYDEDGMPLLESSTFERPFDTDGLYLEVGCAEGKAGDTVTIPVYAAAEKALAGFQLFIPATDGLEITDITCPVAPVMKENENILGYVTNPNSEIGAVVTVLNKDGSNAYLENGCIIAEYTFKIPETAKSGDIYHINVNTNDSVFATNADNSMMCKIDRYCYTLLNGVIAVQ